MRATEPGAVLESFVNSTALEWLIDDIDGFTSQAWQCRPAVLPPRDGLLALYPGPALERILQSGLLRVPFVVLMRQGKHLTPEEYTTSLSAGRARLPGFVDHARLLQAIDLGNTVALNAVELWEPVTRALASAVGLRFGRYTEAVLFYTPPAAQGFATHRDGPDLFAVQLAGTKHWRVHAPPQDVRWNEGLYEGADDPVLETTMRPGDVLYIPRGCAHSAETSNEFSVHMTFGVRGVTPTAIRSILERYVTRKLRDDFRPRSRAEEYAALSALRDEVVAELTRATGEELVATVEQAESLHPVPALAPLKYLT